MGNGATVQGWLAGTVVLPCRLPELSTSRLAAQAGGESLRVKWSKIEVDRSGRDLRETTVLVAQDGHVKVGPDFQGRVSVPLQPATAGDASLILGALRASDAGRYRCDLLLGVEDAQATVALAVDGEDGGMGGCGLRSSLGLKAWPWVGPGWMWAGPRGMGRA